MANLNLPLTINIKKKCKNDATFVIIVSVTKSVSFTKSLVEQKS